MTSIPETIGRYQIISRIGHVRVSALYCAWDPQLDLLVAIKILMADDDELRDRFRLEARSLASLRHPHIACIHDVAEDQQRPFVAMEYIEGRTLADRIDAGPPFSTRRALHAMRELCDGLAFAHRSSIVHGAVQPADIMFDANDVLKIVGFGIARAAQATTEQAGVGIGPLKYLSPEQAEGRPADLRSDIFAVGAVFHELIAGRQGFPGGPEPPALPSTLDPDIVRIIGRCLEKEPDRRFPDLGAMQDDICRLFARLPDADESDATMSRWLLRVVGRRTPVPAPDLTRRAVEEEEPAGREAKQMQTNIEKAERALAAGDYDAAIAACEEALLLDSHDEQAFDLLDRARTAFDERHAHEWLDQAEGELLRGAPAAASDLVERAAALGPALPRVAELRRSVDEARTRREGERQRAEAVWRLLERAEDLFDRGSWLDALEAAEEALALDAESADAHLLKRRAHDAIEAHQRAERRARQQRIIAEIASARDELARERWGDAHARLRALKDAEGESPDIDLAIAAVDEAQAEAERKVRLERELAEHVARAAGLLARNDAGAALSRVDSALAIDPHHGAATALKARIQQAVQIAARRAETEQRLARDRAQRIAHALEAAQLAGSHAAAIASLNEVLEHDPAHVIARQLLEQRREAQARERAEKERRLEAERVQREQVNRLDDIASFEEDSRPSQGDATPPEEPTAAPGEEPAPLHDEHASSKNEEDAAVGSSTATLFRMADQSGGPDLQVQTGQPPHTPWLMVLIASAVIAVVAGTVYFAIVGAFSPDRQPAAVTSPQPAPVASAIAPDAISRQVAESQARAELAFARGDWLQGLAAVDDASRLRPGDVALEDILDAALRDARAQMIEAREAAQRAGAVGSLAFRNAEQKRREADRLARAGHSHEAIRALWDGIQLIDRVRVETETKRPTPDRSDAQSTAAPR